MSIRTIDRIGDWETVPFAGGYSGLHALADDEFSGVVVAGPSQLFMLNGTVVGVLDGDIEAFEKADGTARTAPHEALPLLAVMQERADEVRGQYYTQDTPIADVDSTLSDGKFTGFVELSENVLSGDYFVVYHQGRSMSVAWVGSAERLITDDDAFEQANDEVGIYEVKPVDIEPIEIPDPVPEPEPESEASTDAAAADAVDAAETDQSEPDAAEQAPAEPDPSAADDASGAVDSAPEADRGSDDGPAEQSPTASDRRRRASGGPPGSKAAGASQGTAASPDADGADAERSEDAADSATASEQPPRSSDSEPSRTESPREDHASQSAARERGGVTEQSRAETDAESTASTSQSSHPESTDTPDSDDRTTESRADEPIDRSRTDAGAEPDRSQTQQPQSAGVPGSEDSSSTAASVTDLETHSIPSLDPDQSTSSAGGESSTSNATPSPTESQRSTETPPSDEPESRTAQQSEASQSTDRSAPAEDESTAGSTRRAESREVQELETAVADREAEIAELEADVDELAGENEDLRTQRDELESQLADARAEIERLEERLADARGPGAAASTQLTGSEAISETNLFVRYDSKGEATLAKAHDGKATREDVEANLRLEYHTQFDADDAAVDGRAFEEFLHDSIQYRFVDWLIRNLLYEIENTGHQTGMQDLFDAIPEIDRAELNGQVSVEYTENGEQHRSQERFDVVVRDRMGNPLVVANINDSREPASDDQMTRLVQNGERVGTASDSLAAAFLVTSSFFDPGALETAKEATSSGLLSRDKKKSYVNLSRKDGFHLCLLEARNNEFHLAVPEL